MLRITVHSYKGGTGKTTITTNLANQITDQGKKALLIETDYVMPVYHGIFASLKPTRFFNELYEKSEININDLIYSNSPLLDIIFSDPDFKPDDPIFRIDQDKFGRKINQLIKVITNIQANYDYIIFDTPPGWNFPTIGNLLVSDILLVVLRPNIYEVHGTLRLIKELYRKTRLTKDLLIYAIFNQIPDVEHGIEFVKWKKKLEEENVQIIAEIDCSCELSKELGWGVTLVPPESFLYSNLTKIINRFNDMMMKD